MAELTEILEDHQTVPGSMNYCSCGLPFSDQPIRSPQERDAAHREHVAACIRAAGWLDPLQVFEAVEEAEARGHAAALEPPLPLEEDLGEASISNMLDLQRLVDLACNNCRADQHDDCLDDTQCTCARGLNHLRPLL